MLDSTLPCFTSGELTAQQLRERFQLGLTQAQCNEFVDRLVDSSAVSVFTRLYDAFQVCAYTVYRMCWLAHIFVQAYSQGIL